MLNGEWLLNAYGNLFVRIFGEERIEKHASIFATLFLGPFILAVSAVFGAALTFVALLMLFSIKVNLTTHQIVALWVMLSTMMFIVFSFDIIRETIQLEWPWKKNKQ